jgi:hypothetical protein
MMDPAGHPDLVTTPEMAMPGNLEILAQTAASQSNEDPPTFSGKKLSFLNGKKRAYVIVM